jgi:hypothetical protein
LAVGCQKQGVLVACTNHVDLKAIECCYLVRSVRLFTFFGIEAALAEEIRATTNHVIVTS